MKRKKREKNIESFVYFFLLNVNASFAIIIQAWEQFSSISVTVATQCVINLWCVPVFLNEI